MSAAAFRERGQPFARPYFVTPHAVLRWRERVEPLAHPEAAIRQVQAALQHTRPEWRAPGADGRVIIVGAPWRGRGVLFVIDEQPARGEWPVVVTIGGESHRRRWLRWVDARERGLIRPAHRHWRPAERDYLIDHITRVPLAEIARRLGRTEKALLQYCWRERICATRQDLLTSGEAATVYGLTAQRLTALARAGRIAARRVPGGRWWLFEPPARVLPGSPGTGRVAALR